MSRSLIASICLTIVMGVLPFMAMATISDFSLIRDTQNYQQDVQRLLSRLSEKLRVDDAHQIAVLASRLNQPLADADMRELYKQLIYLHFSFDEKEKAIYYATELQLFLHDHPSTEYSNFSQMVLIAEANEKSRDTRATELVAFFQGLPSTQQADVKFYFTVFKSWLDRRSPEALTLNLVVNDPQSFHGSAADKAIALHIAYLVEDVPELKFANLTRYLDFAEQHDVPVKYVVHFYNLVSYVMYVLGDPELAGHFTQDYVDYALSTGNETEIYFAYLKQAQQLALLKQPEESLRLIAEAKQHTTHISTRWQLQMRLLEAEQNAVSGNLALATAQVGDIETTLTTYKTAEPPELQVIKTLISLQQSKPDDAMIQITSVLQTYRNILNNDRLNYLREIAKLKVQEHDALLDSESSLHQAEQSNQLLQLSIFVISLLLAALVVMLWRQSKTHRQVVELSQMDSLTRLYNRGHWQKGLERILQAQKSTPGSHCSLLLLDVDHFKRINDTYGHTTGDSVLKEVAAIINQSIRKTDLAGRYGGEEFALVLPDTHHERAIGIAERLREKIELHRSDIIKDDLTVTVSIGVANLEPDYDTITQWINAADTALYSAKRGGRNQVVFA